MRSEHHGDATPRIIFGLILFTLGVLFLLDRLDIVEMGRLWDYWPLIFVGVGLGKVMQPAGAPGRAGGVIFIIVGIWWLLANLDLLEHDPIDFWPVVLILLGGSMLLRAIDSSRHPAAPAMPPPFPGDLSQTPQPPAADGDREAAPPTYEAYPTINAVGVLGGVGRKSAARDFRGGSLTAIMGGVEIDLRQASIASGEAAIDTFALWGGVEVKVPRDWLVVSKGMPLLGGFVDSTTPPPTPTGKVLIVRGMAIMGGVEIKN